VHLAVQLAVPLAVQGLALDEEEEWVVLPAATQRCGKLNGGLG
jgi:hypothetical protein